MRQVSTLPLTRQVIVSPTAEIAYVQPPFKFVELTAAVFHHYSGELREAVAIRNGHWYFPGMWIGNAPVVPASLLA